jgi:hypothetical protein|tara:strand:+ start:6656 stop:7276 length:621 start_codon:yes stop_codon:yes gene_type:complete
MAQSIDTFKAEIRSGVAMNNMFRVLLPSLPGSSGRQLNLLCKTTNMPGRQILTTERKIGIQSQKVAYGYAIDDVSMTFHLLNDYGVKNYFDNWMNMAVNNETLEVNYKKEYCQDIIIQQLRKDIIMDLGFNFNIGPFNIGGDVIGPDQIAYTCVLQDAFPTSMAAQEFNNEQGGTSELTVQLSYTNWNSRSGGILETLANVTRLFT